MSGAFLLSSFLTVVVVFVVAVAVVIAIAVAIGLVVAGVIAFARKVPSFILDMRLRQAVIRPRSRRATSRVRERDLAEAFVMIPVGITFIVLGILVALPGCGFQPRGSLALPGEVRIEGGPFELREALRAGLVGSGARVAGTASSPPASGATPAPGMLVVAITDADFSEQLVTVEPRFGTAREYRITLQVRYQVHGVKPDIAPGEVMLEREYRRHPGERARTGPERAQIEGEMLQEAARAILRRLHVLTRAG